MMLECLSWRWLNGWACFFLYLILGNFGLAFQAVKKQILHTSVFPGGLLSFSLKPRVKENASTSIISLNNIFCINILIFLVWICVALTKTLNSSRYVILMGVVTSNQMFLKKTLIFFVSSSFFMCWCCCSHDGQLLLMVPCDCNGGRRQPAVCENRWQHWPDQCHLEQLRGTRTAVMVQGLV